MILVDTSIWIDHLRNGNPELERHLMAGRVLCHPMIVAELALGSLKAREEILTLLDNLPRPPIASDPELRRTIEARNLHGRGIGYVDVNLVASCLLAPAIRLWTRDRRLNTVAEALGLNTLQPSPRP